jgi:hypothetical protein
VNFDVPQSALYPAESGAHLRAKFSGLVAIRRDFLPIRSNLDGDDVEELQNLVLCFVTHRSRDPPAIGAMFGTSESPGDLKC